MSGGGRVERDRTGHKGQTQEAFPIGAGGHTQNSRTAGSDSRRTKRPGSDITRPRQRFMRKALLVANDFLEQQLDELRAKVSTGYARGRLPPARERKDQADV
jgi:hypothetical protein